MPKANLWNKSVPRVEPDQRARNTHLRREAARFHRIMPGLLLCGVVTLGAIAMQVAEEHLFGRVWLEALVLAILLGTAIRTAWTPHPRWLPGINFSAKSLLEVAVLLLGASWTRVRAVAQAQPDVPPALDEPEAGPEKAGTGSTGPA